VVFHEGRWRRDGAPAEARRTLCPACRRIKGRNPAGYLKLRLSPTAPREEILALVHNEAGREGKEHPLSRIIAVEEGKNEILVSTTDTHLPQRIGEALRHAYHGELTLRYSKDQQLVRAWWTQ
jgi:NMD protein affecting ribosome stability and mRNA decay